MSRPSPTGRPRWCSWWEQVVLGHPAWTVLVVLGLAAVPLAELPDFRVEASSDALVLEGDRDLRFYSQTRREFGSDRYLLVALAPEAPLFRRSTLDSVAELVSDLEEVEGVSDASSLLTAPLLHSPDVGLFELADGYHTIEEPSTSLDLARAELETSPLYSDRLVSADGEIAVVRLELAGSRELDDLARRRVLLRERRREGGFERENERELERVEDLYRRLSRRQAEETRRTVSEVRSVLDAHRELGEIHLAGMPMIAADMVSFIEHDLVVFGIAVVAFVLVALALLFRAARWVLAPTAVCVLTVTTLMGMTTLLGWSTTIVSSNVGSLLFILTMAMVVHFAARHSEERARSPEASQRELTGRTVAWVAKPCLYTALTTVVGFGSLYASGIRPVMDFALMVVLGLAIGFVLTFTLLPALLALSGKGSEPDRPLGEMLVGRGLSWLARLATERRAWIVAATLALLPLAAVGMSRLQVENRFVDYFDPETEIHQGMEFLDRRLGGTTPLEVVIGLESADAWLDPDRLDGLAELHDWLADQPEIGKVVSLATLVRVVEGVLAVTDNPLLPEHVNRALLGQLRARAPPELEREVLAPYLSDDGRQARLAMRVRESRETLDRQSLIERIDEHLSREDAAFRRKDARITGLFVLYNNLLQSLFRSQVQTLAVVAIAVWSMLWLLFRSPLLALAGLIPNLLPVVVVLGLLGWLGIPLDLMTVMIAAITLGIGVDDSVHWMHRFVSEVRDGAGEREAVARTHQTVGRAVVYTSVTVVFGFSILTASSFTPTVYFGLFAGLAMLVALLGALTLLPVLLLWWRPIEPAKGGPSEPEGSTA